MAFILKSTKFLHSVIECSRHRAVTRTGKNVIFSLISRSPVIEEVTVRSTVSLAAQEQNNNLNLETAFFRLNGDIRNRRLFLETAKDVFDIVKQKGEMTEPQLLLLLKCCSEVSFMSSPEERIKFVEEIWKSTADFGVELNINHYNALLSVFLENNHKFSPSEFLKVLEEKGIEPNLVTHKRILKAFCQKGDIKGASSVLEKMKQLNFPLSEEDFNALIQCHSEMGEFQKANEILKVMESREIEPTGKSYLNLLCGYAKYGQIKKFMELLEKLSLNEIYLSCSDILEIIYVLAVNDQHEHIDKIMQKLTNDYEQIKGANVIIQRLLHKKMDSTALDLFEKLELKSGGNEYISFRSKHILRHFALYRNPEETLDMCKKLHVKGWTNACEGFVLQQVYLYKDENFCFNFLQTMIERNMRMRSHYFWPQLIKASEKGNSELINVLSIIPPKTLANCLFSTSKIVFPNYKFSDNWQEDNEVLLKAGLPQKFLSLCFIEKFLRENKIEEVERLVSLYPVYIERYINLLKILIEYVQAHPEEVERFVNIIYYLAHDLHFKYTGDSQDAEESLQEASLKNIFDDVVITFVRALKDEKVFEQVLQKMLEKKFGISAEGLSVISESQELSNLADLAKKLSDPGLKLVYDDNLLKLKFQSKGKKNGRDVYFKKYNEGDEINIEELKKELAEGGSFLKAVYSVRNLIRINRYEDAINLAEVLRKTKDQSLNSKSRLFFQVINDLYSFGQSDWAEKAFYLGVDMGILSLNDYVLCINNLFLRGECSLAVEKYCSHLEKTKNASRVVEFLICLVSNGSEDDLRRIMTPLVNLLGKNLFMTYLVIAFVESGNFTKAKKLLETKKFKLIDNNFNFHCALKARKGTSKELENFLKLVKDLEFFDRVPLYKLLIKKYAEEENIEKVKNLWLLIEEDDISDYYFLEKMRDLMDEPSVAELKNTATFFQESGEMRRGQMKSFAS